MLDEARAIDRAAYRIDLREGEPVSYGCKILAAAIRLIYWNKRGMRITDELVYARQRRHMLP